jgi:zinc transport system permease protein
MMLLDNFLILAALAGLGVAIAAAPLGCFVVWRRMAYFGDATAHASILGVVLALTFSTSVFAGVLVVSLIMAITVSTLSGRGYAMDTLLGVLAHSALAFGLVAVSLLQGVRIDLMAYLFGDILAVGTTDLVVIWGGAVLVLALVAWRWSALLTATLNPDLAYASGIDPKSVCNGF